MLNFSQVQSNFIKKIPHKEAAHRGSVVVAGAHFLYDANLYARDGNAKKSAFSAHPQE